MSVRPPQETEGRSQVRFNVDNRLLPKREERREAAAIS